MSQFTNLHVRQSQLVRPFGVGAIHTLPGNITYVTGGLKYWFYDHKSPNGKIIKEQSKLSTYIVRDKRLQKRLGVDHLKIPPGFDNEKGNDFEFKIPLYRFPTWYVCSNSKCSRMERRSLTQEGLIKCSNPECNSLMTQVRFASVCPKGCLQDFPWREWVCGENTNCSDNDYLIYKSSGGASLSDIYISCPKCSNKRSLKGILQRYEDGSTELSNKTYKSNKVFKCPGGEVWNGKGQNEDACCEEYPSGILINGLNVHYSHILSSIWIPEKDHNSKLAEIIGENDIQEAVSTFEAFGGFSNDEIIDRLFGHNEYGPLLSNTSKEQLRDYLFPEVSLSEDIDVLNQHAILYPEYNCFKSVNTSLSPFEFLNNRIESESKGPIWYNNLIQKVSIIDKLRETSVLYGFSRLTYDSNLSYSAGYRLLWGSGFDRNNKWLPANVVNGEGFMIYLNYELVKRWENEFYNSKTFKAFTNRVNRYLEDTNRADPEITPKFILIHTLSHLLMKNLAFNSGYDISSIKESLYCSDIENEEMLGLMIYTASGDSQGSMGGLAKNGEAENLLPLIKKSFEDSQYCTNDPVCRESSEYGGQGIYGLNGASCYACTLVPETSCTHFNSFLDREVLNDFINFIMV